jgi:NADH dehydrogenase [ubiquinone] 1 alpha subcomplex assembly factor 6
MAKSIHSRDDGIEHRNALSPIGALVRNHDRDRFQTALFAPAGSREALFALYAFNYEIARVRESVREPMLGQIRLQWWRDVVEAAYTGAPPRWHEVVEPLTAIIREHGLSRAHFDRLIDSRERDLDPAPPATLAELEDYAEGSSAPLIHLALETLGAATPDAMAAATEIGIAYALTGIIRALPHAARTGWQLLPADAASPREAVQAIAMAAAAHLRAAQTRRRAVPARAVPALLPARVAKAALRRIERAGFDPFAPGVADSDPLQPWRLAVASLFRRF